MRVAAEQVAKTLLAQVEPDLEESTIDEQSLSEVLAKLKNHLPERMYLHFQTVRQGGNYGSHYKSDHAAMGPGDVEPTRIALEQILNWVDPATNELSVEGQPGTQDAVSGRLPVGGIGVLTAAAVIIAFVAVLWSSRAEERAAPTRSDDSSELREMVRVSAGSVTIGSSNPDGALQKCREELGSEKCPAHVFDREREVRTVRVDAFEIDKFEVTVGEVVAWLQRTWRSNRLTVQDGRVESSGRLWALLVQEPWISFRFHPSQGFAPAARDAYPAASLTWWAASAFCAQHGLRLPSEAEWQRAALGSEAHISPSCASVVFGRTSALPCEHLPDAPGAVGSGEHDLSPSGVHGLTGSLSEWTNTDFEADDPDEDPRRVVKGGSYIDTPVYLSPKRRYVARPDYSSSSIGFRCARSI